MKRLANPDLDDENLLLLDSLMAGVLFTPKDTFSLVPKSFLVMVGVYLQRPIRLLNRMLFWSVVESTRNHGSADMLNQRVSLCRVHVDYRFAYTLLVFIAGREDI